MENKIELLEGKDIPKEDIMAFYNSIVPSKLLKLKLFYNGIMSSDVVVTAWDDDELIAIGSAISEDNEVVYFSEIVVSPDYKDMDLEESIQFILEGKFKQFEKQIHLSEKEMFEFYKKCKCIENAF